MATPRSSGPQRDAVGSEIARTTIETRVRGIVQGVGFRSFVYRTDGGSHPSVLWHQKRNPIPTPMMKASTSSSSTLTPAMVTSVSTLRNLKSKPSDRLSVIM